jgi:riboflavin synthase
MFTGLIEALCIVKSVRYIADAMQLTIDLSRLADETKVGDSIAVNGVCLTIAQLLVNVASFDVSPETLRKSTIGKLKTGSQVNVERAVKAGDRLGGHIIEGHIDGTATIAQINRRGDFANIKFSARPELLDQMMSKGSVAVDGISLTIANLDKNSFSAIMIPETLKKTTLGNAKNGDCVNIETDIIVKTIKKQLDKILPQKQNLTVEKMKDMGF